MPRGLRVGPNLDITTRININDSHEQARAISYIRSAKPLVVVMSPTCRPYGHWARYNSVLYPDTWKMSYAWVSPHGRFCGKVALLQLRAGRFFMLEQTAGNTLLDEPEWAETLDSPEVKSVNIHQCATGLRNAACELCYIPTIIVSTSADILTQFRNCVCDKTHPHGRATTEQQHWTNKFASRIVSGIISLKRRVAECMYPVVGTTGCRACKSHRSATDPEHTRDPTYCRFPRWNPSSMTAQHATATYH